MLKDRLRHIMRFSSHLLLPFVVVLLSSPAIAQITAPGASAVRFTKYGEGQDARDPIFVFCSPGSTGNASLMATSPIGEGPFDFSWYRWDEVSKSFSISVKTEDNVFSSSLSSIEEGGYRVFISDGVDTSLTAWVFFDRPWSDARLRNPMKNCDYVALKGTAAVDTFYYYNTVSGAAVKLDNEVSFLWSSQPASTIPRPDFVINPVTNIPPLEDVTYYLTVTDSMGCVSESSFFYESIHVDALFSAAPMDGESPLEVSFTNESIRGSSFHWDFGDGSEPSDLEVPDPHVFYLQDTVKQYKVVLTIESDHHCIDSASLKITLDPSSLEIPNVFTPNDDGYNDRFTVSKTSLLYLSVDIFSQTGVRVYSFYGDSEKLRNWEGWNGNVNGSSRKASPGIYFYIIKARGWDNVRYDSKEYRGTVYLYR